MQRSIELKQVEIQLAGPAPLLGVQLVTLHAEGKILDQSHYKLPLVAEDFTDELLELLNRRLVALGLCLVQTEQAGGAHVDNQ